MSIRLVMIYVYVRTYFTTFPVQQSHTNLATHVYLSNSFSLFLDIMAGRRVSDLRIRVVIYSAVVVFSTITYHFWLTVRVFCRHTWGGRGGFFDHQGMRRGWESGRKRPRKSCLRMHLFLAAEMRNKNLLLSLLFQPDTISRKTCITRILTT